MSDLENVVRQRMGIEKPRKKKRAQVDRELDEIEAGIRVLEGKVSLLQSSPRPSPVRL